jgi:hypothetical protein
VIGWPVVANFDIALGGLKHGYDCKHYVCELALTDMMTVCDFAIISDNYNVNEISTQVVKLFAKPK